MVRRLIAVVVYRATLRSDDPNEVLNGICYVRMPEPRSNKRGGYRFRWHELTMTLAGTPMEAATAEQNASQVRYCLGIVRGCCCGFESS